MAFEWTERPRVADPDAEFRIQSLSRSIETQTKTDGNDLWWVLVVVPLEKLSLRDLLGRAEKLMLNGEVADFLYVPGEFTAEEVEEPRNDLITLYARRNYIDRVNQDPETAGIRALELGPVLREDQIRFGAGPIEITPRSRKVIEVPKGTVVTAVIDNGMAIGHELFLRQAGGNAPTSRTEFFWDMDGTMAGDEVISIGSAWTRPTIDAALAANTHAGLLDDAAFYSELGIVDFARRDQNLVAHRVSHGTHVMGLVAGYDTDDPKGDLRPIIGVNLRTSDVKDPSGKLFAFWLTLGLDYIIKRYKRFRIEGTKDSPPMVINFSFGNYSGPHDGTGLISQKIASAMKTLRKMPGPFEFVLPDGNSNQSRTHARVELTSPSDRVVLEWQVQPADISESSVEFWLDKTGPVGNTYATMTVTGPGNIGSVSVTSDATMNGFDLTNSQGQTVGHVHFSGANSADERGHFTIRLNATDDPEGIGNFAPAGLWKIGFKTGELTEVVGLKGWIIRDEDLPGFPPFGRQSYFNVASYTRYYEPGVDANALDQELIGGLLGYDPLNEPSPVKRSGTLSGFTGGDDPIVVGGFVRSTERMALYSSTGPTNNPARTGPIASAPSDDGTSAFGVISAGSASGSMVALPGTSMAAPQVARWIGDQMSAGQPSDRVAVGQAAAAMDPDPATKPPDIRSGCGRMAGLPNLFGQLRGT